LKVRWRFGVGRVLSSTNDLTTGKIEEMGYLRMDGRDFDGYACPDA